MRPKGLHLLLTYLCNYECDHCFVWGGPEQSGTMSYRSVRLILEQGRELGGVEWIYFEGGEPFLFYPILRKGIEDAARMGFQTGIVSNAYWATELEDAVEWLKPMAGILNDLSVSHDRYHGEDKESPQVENACRAAESLQIPAGIISIAQPEAADAPETVGVLPQGESAVMFRGRAAVKLSAGAGKKPWTTFQSCPFEELRAPGRVHLDPFGNVHICQGIVAGNLLHKSLREICDSYSPETHPVIGPLLREGPAGLVRRHGLPHEENYADACHLCYQARCSLRSRFPGSLLPDQMYGPQE